jgi:hypothetical protein
MSRQRTLALLLTVVVAGAIGLWAWTGLKSPPVPEPARIVTTPPGWQRFNAGLFTFFAPAGTRLKRKSGVDWAGGEITGPGFCIDFIFSNLTDGLEGLREELLYSQRWISIDGRPALLRRATLRSSDGEIVLRECGYKSVSGVFIPYALDMPSGSGRSHGMALTLEGSVASDEERGLIESIFSSIRFTQPK